MSGIICNHIIVSLIFFLLFQRFHTSIWSGNCTCTGNALEELLPKFLPGDLIEEKQPSLASLSSLNPFTSFVLCFWFFQLWCFFSTFGFLIYRKICHRSAKVVSSPPGNFTRSLFKNAQHRLQDLSPFETLLSLFLTHSCTSAVNSSGNSSQHPIGKPFCRSMVDLLSAGLGLPLRLTTLAKGNAQTESTIIAN